MARQAQPGSVNGTPEDIIKRAERRATAQLAAWVGIFSKAVEGKTTAKAINSALIAAAKRLPVSTFRKGVEGANFHGSMLGALDSDWEQNNSRQIEVEEFRVGARVRSLVGAEQGFSNDPLGQASETFFAKDVVDADTFAAMQKSAQRQAFTVANQASRQMLKDTQRELARQVAVGSDLRTFKKFVDARLVSAGWTPVNPSHVETIFRTNVMGAYNQGRARQASQPIVLELFPLWQIVTVNDGPPRQRATHQAVHGVVLRADDSFWQTAYPPFGFNCRCRVRSVTESAFGNRVRSGSSITGLPDPGFSSGVGGLLAA